MSVLITQQREMVLLILLFRSQWRRRPVKGTKGNLLLLWSRDTISRTHDYRVFLSWVSLASFDFLSQPKIINLLKI